MRWMGLRDEAGFALPSILMLVTILTLVAFSVIALTYLEYQAALTDASRVKAEYAAQSGVARVLAELTDLDPLPVKESEHSFAFFDGSRASVTVHPWGALPLIESRGFAGRTTATRFALAARQPGDEFRNALVLGNTSHQLVFTGTSKVTGNVAVGPGGATTGTIYGYTTPMTLPITGRIVKMAPLPFPQASAVFVQSIGEYYNRLRDGLEAPSGALSVVGTSLSALPDTVTIVSTSGGAVLGDSLAHPQERIYVRNSGILSIASRARISGLVTIVADSIFIERGAVVSGGVFVATKGIRVQAASLSSAQLLAPRITVDSGCVAGYPSLLLSLPMERGKIGAQQILLRSGSDVEGFVGMVSPFETNLVVLEPRARVTGTIFTNARLRMDGTVYGSVMARDLYFYTAPTTYLGWMRMGAIDRSALPGGFLVPPIFVSKKELAVLQW